MKFLEIKEDVSVAIDKIEAIEATDTMTSRVYTISGIAYESPFPKDVLLQLIEMQHESSDDGEVVEQLKLMNNSHQMWAGR